MEEVHRGVLGISGRGVVVRAGGITMCQCG